MNPTLIIENFIEDKTIDILLSLMDKVNFESTPNNANLFSCQTSNEELTKNISQNINDKLTSTIETFYLKKVYHYTSGSVIRYNEGQFIGPHADWAAEDKYVVDEEKTKVDLSSILYLNDDFLGGDLVFLEKENIINLSLKPKKNTAIFFDALKVHYTTPIVEGCKYSYTSFYSLKD
jgi:predicted 2-oxoglutarate/Fe(II)-dependent dioxygenase YbiX